MYHFKVLHRQAWTPLEEGSRSSGWVKCGDCERLKKMQLIKGMSVSTLLYILKLTVLAVWLTATCVFMLGQ